MSQSKKLAEAVSVWLATDAKVEKELIPSLADLERICRGNMVDVFQYLINCVHSEEYLPISF